MIYTRTICFFLVVLGALFLPFWFFVFSALLYALVFSPYELMFLGVFIDAEFGNPEAGVWYAYTLSMALICVGAMYTKPYLRFYR